MTFDVAQTVKPEQDAGEEAPAAKRVKKPYQKPVVVRLGTREELTQRGILPRDEESAQLPSPDISDQRAHSNAR